MKVVADNKIPFLAGVLEPFAEVIYLPGGKISKKDLQEADALLVRTRTQCNEALLEGTTIKFIATATIGYDHLDTEYLKLANITWTNAPGCNSGSVQQYLGAVLCQIAEIEKTPLAGKTIGIIGVGNVGKKVEALAKALGMKVLRNDPPRSREEGETGFTKLEELLQLSDFVTVHTPLNLTGPDQTFHLLNQERLNLMKPSAFLINSSRGEVVDGKALKAALKSKIIKGAVLDVWENEPEIDLELLDLVSIATPHIAGYSQDGKANGTAQSVRALAIHFNLPLKDFYPKNMPAPDQPFIDISNEQEAEKQLNTAILHTYPIQGDDLAFRKAPESFEKLRGDYPVRREFASFTVRNVNNATVRTRLKAIGFGLQ
jgi:erythronate-4-phosphate dehydrogenase